MSAEYPLYTSVQTTAIGIAMWQLSSVSSDLQTLGRLKVCTPPPPMLPLCDAFDTCLVCHSLLNHILIYSLFPIKESVHTVF